MMDYYAIGQRIRKIRKAHKLSQETLSERIGISVTHMKMCIRDRYTPLVIR